MQFLRNEMQIKSPLSFHRVHRIKNYETNYINSHPVVASFERFQDREFAKKNKSPDIPNNKPYVVGEQFPKVMEEKA